MIPRFHPPRVRIWALAALVTGMAVMGPARADEVYDRVVDNVAALDRMGKCWTAVGVEGGYLITAHTGRRSGVTESATWINGDAIDITAQATDWQRGVLLVKATRPASDRAGLELRQAPIEPWTPVWLVAHPGVGGDAPQPPVFLEGTVSRVMDFGGSRYLNIQMVDPLPDMACSVSPVIDIDGRLVAIAGRPIAQEEGPPRFIGTSPSGLAESLRRVQRFGMVALDRLEDEAAEARE